MIPSYIRDSSAAIVVYDINDRQTFDSVDKWIEDVRAIEKDEIFLLIVGNKLDIGRREVTQNDAMAKAKFHNCECIETSAKTNININELFEKVTEKLVSMEGSTDDAIDTVDVTAKDGKEGGCC